MHCKSALLSGVSLLPCLLATRKHFKMRKQPECFFPRRSAMLRHRAKRCTDLRPLWMGIYAASEIGGQVRTAHSGRFAVWEPWSCGRKRRGDATSPAPCPAFERFHCVSIRKSLLGRHLPTSWYTIGCDVYHPLFRCNSSPVRQLG